jgi:aminoglycoside phosphotransferase (APT) family kinase protein
VAGLLGRFHQATAGWVPPESLSWSDELPDPVGGPVVCHNDVCPENVVFRDGRAVGLVDFDFAAPGRPEWDVVRTIGMWAPLGDPTSRRAHPPGLDAVHRFGIFAAASGIGADGAEALVDLAGLSKESGLRFVRRRLDAAEPAFVEMWEASGGDARWAGDRAWLEEHRRFLAGAVVAAGS